MLNKENLLAYNRYRKNTDLTKVCHAPFVNLNFEQNGHVTACCFNREDVLGIYPQNSLMEIWNGVAAKDMRKKIESLDLDNGCKLCGILIESGNYSGTKAIYYDEFAPKRSLKKIKDFLEKDQQKWPRVFEFEISNTCNLECGMCSGYFSSTIRKNREQLPPIFEPYDDDFVEQLIPFLSYLTDMKFLGGEPFLIDRYYKIWEKVAEINPKIRIHITTNGTVFNQRVKTLLNQLRAGIVVSIDSLDPERYASIRKGSELNKVLKNVELFKEVVQKNNTYLTIAACVMTNNWMDLPSLLKYCNQNNFNLHFNIVWNPEKFSLRFLKFHELEKIQEFLLSQNFQLTTSLHRKNHEIYQEMVASIEHWKLEQSHTRLQEIELNRAFAFNDLEIFKIVPKEFQELFFVLLFHFCKGKKELLSQLLIHADRSEFYQIHSLEVFKYLKLEVEKDGEAAFLKKFFQTMSYWIQLFYKEDLKVELIEKAKIIFTKLSAFKNSEKIVSDMLMDIDKRSFMATIEMLKENEVKVLSQHLDTIYSL